ncbi:MAG: alpha-amylase family glycosyl hydrolase [Rikenellaceae bacterium]
MSKTLPIIERDSWLKPAADKLQQRHDLYLAELSTIESHNKSISEYANAHHHFGWQRDNELGGWWFREWLPAAKAIYLFGDFNDWSRFDLPLTRDENGVWSIFLHDGIFIAKLTHGSLYKIHVIGLNGARDRIPAYATRVIQNEITKDFAAQFWNPSQPYIWSNDNKNKNESKNEKPLIIYEAHIGMAIEREGIGLYTEFEENILPEIARKGYTALQLMAIAEHPYYGSFGYHVSSFFAPSSRFGTPEELKSLIDKAHKLGLIVIMDLVHAHYVKNLNEGLNELDGSANHYSPAGDAGRQPHWDSMLFDYSKGEVRHFLLSNIKYWIEEFHFDGFRFDGVSSMLYKHHGHTEFDSRDRFFDDDVNLDALTYLTLANKLIHSLNPNATTIAEDVSGMPALCSAIDDGGIGFDYRLAMAIPDYWISLLEKERDEQWDIWQMWRMMNSRLADVGTIAYVESHDQAMVGDKTIAMRLMGKSIYTDMDRATTSLAVERGIALHKIIRLATITMGGNGYLNFMGNEFGHPEWIDFPRKGNNWSYKYAKRQWSLEENGYLRYSLLSDWDRAMIALVREHGVLSAGESSFPYLLQMDEVNKTMAYRVADLVVVLNWHGNASLAGYELNVGIEGRYRAILSSDESRFGGLARVAMLSDSEHESYNREGNTYIKIYNTSRSATIYKRDR